MAQPILKAFPFPWATREAQDLHITMCQLYPTAKGALFIAQKIDLEVYRLNGDQEPYFVWKEVLDMAANTGKVRDLVQLVRDQNKNNPSRNVLDDLLAEKAVMSSELRAPDGTPVFITATDTVSEQEALLFRDDLTLSTGRIPWLIEILLRLQTLSPAVCRLECRYGDHPSTGTGFRIGPDLILTNWHVLVNSWTTRTATAVSAGFGYDDDANGKPKTADSYDCDVTSIVTNRDDDWGVIRTQKPLPDSVPIIALSTGADPKEETPAFILQHPQGLPKRVGYVRNTITMCNDRVFHYLTDTQPGSSGSPVFDNQGRLIGLHHVGGRPQEVAGKMPLKKNEGIRIQRVIEGLAKAGIRHP
jgi:V8-like Glu-specific endopeptidase